LARIGNQSNLIPDPDSHHTMSIVVLRLPEFLLASADPSAAVLRRGPATPMHSADAQVQHRVLEGRLDIGQQGMGSGYTEAYAASIPELARALADATGDDCRAGPLAPVQRVDSVGAA
jgi:hypothetical protein